MADVNQVLSEGSDLKKKEPQTGLSNSKLKTRDTSLTIKESKPD